jgi:hypothetical protein
MRTTRSLVLAVLLAGLPLLYVGAAHAADEISCSMQFEMHGWSIFYKTAKGTGEVTCSNGQHMRVHLRSKGGGLTVGKSSITGTGRFSGLFDIKGVLGTYATGTANAGAVKTAHSTVMVKGNVALALTGKGRGWNLGVDFGKFIISR